MTKESLDLLVTLSTYLLAAGGVTGVLRLSVNVMGRCRSTWFRVSVDLRSVATEAYDESGRVHEPRR